jgi:hypothetical protein
MKYDKSLRLAIVVGAERTALRTTTKARTVEEIFFVLVRAFVNANQGVFALVDAFVELLCEFFLASLVVDIVVKVLAWAGNAEWVRTALATVRAV